jgi:hypothetical protein
MVNDFNLILNSRLAYCSSSCLKVSVTQCQRSGFNQVSGSGPITAKNSPQIGKKNDISHFEELAVLSEEQEASPGA